MSKAGKWWLAMVAGLLSLSASIAAPSIKSCTITYGGSIRVSNDGWARFTYRLQNPDAETAAVRLLLRPERQRGGAIYDHDVLLPPNAVFTNEIPVTLTRDDQYVAELYYNGNLIDSSTMMVSVASDTDRLLMVLNDDADIGLGNFSKNENLHATYLTVPIGSDSAPEHWSGYDRVSMVAIARPDWDGFNSRQLQALHDFVIKGGVLAFVDPEGLATFAKTDLASMLPVRHLRNRPLDTLPANTLPMRHPAVYWAEGISFAETLPASQGLNTATLEGFPLIRWHRVGLGRVVVSCVNPSTPGIPQDLKDAWWRHILRFGNNGNLMLSAAANPPLTRTIDSLTGLRIPQRGVITRAALGYLAALALIVVAGIFTRRRIQSWLAVAVVSIVFTVSIFIAANRQHADQKPYSASVIRLQLDASGPDESIRTLYARNESTLSIKAQSPESRFRDLPTASSMGRDLDVNGQPRSKNKTINLKDPLAVTLRNGVPHLDDVMIRGNAVKIHATLSAGDSLALPAAAPLLPIGTAASWPLPAEAAGATAAAALFESGVMAAPVANGQVRIPAAIATENRAPAADVAGIREAVAHLNLPTPTLLLVEPLADDYRDPALPDNFDLSGRTVRLLPLRERVTGAVPAAFGRMPVRPDRGLARSLYGADGWAQSQQRTTASTYEFATWLPHSLLRAELDTIQIRMRADNRGENIRFDVRLRPWDADENDASQDLQATSVDGDRWIFKIDPNHPLADPSNGRIRVVFEAAPIKIIRDPVAALRVNSWTILEFETAVTGSLAPSWTGEL